RRHLGMLVVVQRRLDALHRRHQALLLAVELLRRDHAVGQRAREGVELLHPILDRFVSCLVVEPASACHDSSYSCLTSCLSAVSRSCSAALPPGASVFCCAAAVRKTRSVHSRIAATSCSSRSSPCVDGRNPATVDASASRVTWSAPASSDVR